MSKVRKYLLLTTVLLLTNIFMVNVSAFEKGNPAASYYGDKIVLPDNKVIEIKADYIALFINGTLVTDYEVIMRDGKALVPVRCISQELGAFVDWDGTKEEVTIGKESCNIILSINKDTALVNNIKTVMGSPAILYNNLTYVPLRFLAENLNATLNYASPLETEYEYYYDTQMPVSPANTIIRDVPNIIIDENYGSNQAITKEEAMIRVQRICMEGLDNFKKSTIENIVNSGEDSERFNSEFKSIETEINRMLYLGEVSRYYKFTIGPYDVLYDKYNDNMFFVIYSSGIVIKEVDINDKALFMPIFIVG